MQVQHQRRVSVDLHPGMVTSIDRRIGAVTAGLAAHRVASQGCESQRREELILHSQLCLQDIMPILLHDWGKFAQAELRGLALLDLLQTSDGGGTCACTRSGWARVSEVRHGCFPGTTAAQARTLWNTSSTGWIRRWGGLSACCSGAGLAADRTAIFITRTDGETEGTRAQREREPREREGPERERGPRESPERERER